MNEKDLLDFPAQKKLFTEQLKTTGSKKDVKMIMVITGNTRDPKIGPDCLIDMNAISDDFSKLAIEMKIDYVELALGADAYNKENMLAAIDAIEPGENDIVIFYYSGHGFTFENEEKIRFPQLDLQSQPATIDKEVINKSTQNLSEIFERVKKRGARLNIVIGDCCNSDINFERIFIKNFDISVLRSVKGPLNKEMSKRLFLEPSASVLVASAAKGQVSIINQGRGSIFTSNFLDNLDKMIHGTALKPGSSAWKKLLEQTTEETYHESTLFDIGAEKPEPGNQKAIYEIESLS
jgi:hypothetical protein